MIHPCIATELQLDPGPLLAESSGSHYVAVTAKSARPSILVAIRSRLRRKGRGLVRTTKHQCLPGHWLMSIWAGVLLCLAPKQSPGAEGPFFIPYTHQMEEPGNLGFSTRGISGNPGGCGRFWATVAEFEYGVKGWWTTSI
jgi:hypothetical protein